MATGSLETPRHRIFEDHHDAVGLRAVGRDRRVRWRGEDFFAHVGTKDSAAARVSQADAMNAGSKELRFPLGYAVELQELDRDPYPVFARLAAQEPISWIRALDMWYVVGY